MLELIQDGFLGQGKTEGAHELCHRVAIFNERGQVDSIISQSDIIRYLSVHADRLGMMGQLTLSEAGML